MLLECLLHPHEWGGGNRTTTGLCKVKSHRNRDKLRLTTNKLGPIFGIWQHNESPTPPQLYLNWQAVISEGTLAKKAEGGRKSRDTKLQLHAGKPIMRCTGPKMAGTCSATGPQGHTHMTGPKDKRQYCGRYMYFVHSDGGNSFSYLLPFKQVIFAFVLLFIVFKNHLNGKECRI